VLSGPKHLTRRRCCRRYRWWTERPREVIRLQGDLAIAGQSAGRLSFSPRSPAVFEPCRQAYPDNARFTTSLRRLATSTG